MPIHLLENVTTERLLFRKVAPSDFQAWLPFYHDPSSTLYWNGLPKDPTIACNEQFYRIFERYALNLGGMNAVIHKNTGELLGLCGLLLQTVDGVSEWEIGYSLLPKFRKMGYATEAAKACKTYATKNILAPSLISIIHINNNPSIQVAIKNGMRLDKTTTYKNNPVAIYRVQL